MSERFFIVSSDELKSELVMLDANEAAHALRVLRLSLGDEVWLVDGKGKQARAVIERTNPTLCRVKERIPWPTPKPRVVLGVGISKNPAMDMLAQKLSELTIDEVRPFSAARSVSEPSANKHERWNRISLQALKQCRAARAPYYWAAAGLETVLQAAPPTALKLLAWEDEVSQSLIAALPLALPTEVWALIGPEGGFTSEEVALARSYGFISCRISGSILRAETAAIALASVLRCHWPDSY